MNMKRILSVMLGVSLSIGSLSVAIANSTIIQCPTLSANQYGKGSYVEPRTGQRWQLEWFKHEAPTWQSVSIPQSAVCGRQQQRQGVLVNYQCVVLECQSSAVVARLGQDGSVKCFSAYKSTANNFYCET